MKYEELTIPEKTHVKKHIKEELIQTQPKKFHVNPNEFSYERKRGVLLIQGKLKDMNYKQIKSKIIKTLKKYVKNDKTGTITF